MSDWKWYQFGPFRFDGRLLYRGEKRLDLADRDAKVLQRLVANAFHLVERGELVAFFGKDADSNNLDQAVTRLRTLLGDRCEGRPRSYQYIDTVHGDGFVFKHPVSLVYEPKLESRAGYARAIEWWGTREPDSIRRAIQCFETVLHDDPTFARAHAALADCYATLGSHSWMPARAAAELAEASAKKALFFDGSLAEPHATLGTVYSLFEHRWSDADEELKLAIERAPDYGLARQRHALLLAATGQLTPALEEMRRAKVLDPLSRTIGVHTDTILYWSRHYEEADRHGRETVFLNPRFWYAHYQLALVCEQQGRPLEAVAEQRRALELFPGRSPQLVAALARACALAGERDESRRLLEELSERGEAHGSVFFHIAAAHAALGDADAAFDYLFAASDRKEVWVSFLPVDPRLDGLRCDARFGALLASVGHA